MITIKVKKYYYLMSIQMKINKRVSKNKTWFEENRITSLYINLYLEFYDLLNNICFSNLKFDDN